MFARAGVILVSCYLLILLRCFCWLFAWLVDLLWLRVLCLLLWFVVGLSFMGCVVPGVV